MIPTAEVSDDFSTPEAELVYRASKSWPPEQRAGLLAQLEAARAREAVVGRYRNPAELAATVDPGFNITPALWLIAEAIEALLHSPPGVTRNLLITCPPQEGKSTMASVYTVLRALQLNPNARIILACYGQDLAHGHSRKCRDLIKRHGSGVRDAMTGAQIEDKLGLKLERGANKVSEWSIEGGSGGLVATGLGGTITGKPADLFIIDDPYKHMSEADSATYRAKVDLWMATVATTRLAPGAPTILIQTRWHPEDLAGKVLTAELELPKAQRTWRHINIPAIAEEGIKDALDRAPGEAMVSARGRTKEQFEATKRKVGDRVWYAMYQGSPTNPAGGLFQRSWFEDRRLTGTPILPVASIVGIDPADSGEGDETGIIAGTLTGDGTIALVEDWSGQMTSDEWSRQAVTLALTVGAREIAMEAFATATTYVKVIKRAWEQIHEAAVEKHNAGGILTPVEQRALAPQMPFAIHKWTAKGDAVGRSALLRQACEVGTCRTVEYKLAVFEDQACDWQAGQHQPDRVAAALIAHDRLAALATGRSNLAAPVSDRPSEVPAWLRRTIGRGGL
ncbi:terminase [Mycobacterium phage FrenchFry]|uniref:Terminase n=1 Tax=Mycobacterium phage FrenchFry TaxID=2301543 RepID=A0A385D3A4_9CAUD|nr:terminase [Mycobacterium phage FrenchFry]